MNCSHKPFFNFEIFIQNMNHRGKTICCTRSGDIILSPFFNSVSFTPYTIVMSASLHGAETTTFFAPLLICVNNFSFELNLPVPLKHNPHHIYSNKYSLNPFLGQIKFYFY